jgi:hypothetical protein
MLIIQGAALRANAPRAAAIPLPCLLPKLEKGPFFRHFFTRGGAGVSLWLPLGSWYPAISGGNRYGCGDGSRPMG